MPAHLQLIEAIWWVPAWSRLVRRFVSLSGSTAILSLLPTVALAEAYPARPVRILVGFAAGGNFDLVARLIAQSLTERLGQQFVVENRPGASSNLATEAVIRAPSDGYTLLLGGAVNTINTTLFANLNFDFVKDTAPVSGIVQFPNVVTVVSVFSSEDSSRIHRLRKGAP